MCPATLVTLNMRELDRLKVIQAIVDMGLKPGRAAERLGLTVRQVERLVIRYQESGAAGLASRRRGRSGNRKLDEGLAQRRVSQGCGSNSETGSVHQIRCRPQPPLPRHRIPSRIRLQQSCASSFGVGQKPNESLSRVGAFTKPGAVQRRRYTKISAERREVPTWCYPLCKARLERLTR
ncbi:helix-turn-helix domain-containing protein [Paraburkholderia sp. RL17-373-BIF-A]